MFKKQYNYVMFEIEKEPNSLTEYIDTLQNKFHLRTVYVAVNPKYWKLTVEGTNRAWKEFISSPSTGFTLEKAGWNGKYLFTMKYL